MRNGCQAILGLAAFVLMSLTPYQVSAQSDELTRNYQRGSSFFEAGMYKASARYFVKALELSEVEYGHQPFLHFHCASTDRSSHRRGIFCRRKADGVMIDRRPGFSRRGAQSKIGNRFCSRIEGFCASISSFALRETGFGNVSRTGACRREKLCTDWASTLAEPLPISHC